MSHSFICFLHFSFVHYHFFRQDRLYYTALRSSPSSNQQTPSGRTITYFSIDSELVYWNFFLDFGPLNLGQLYRFSMKLNALLKRKKDDVICFYSASSSTKRANAIYLICAWQLLYLHRTPEEAYRGFKAVHTLRDGEDDNDSDEQDTDNDHIDSYGPDGRTTKNQGSSRSGSAAVDVADERESTSRYRQTKQQHKQSSSSSQNKNVSVAPRQARSITTSSVPPFHDASPCVCTYDITILDCLRGLSKARMYGFFDYKIFDVREYEHFEQVEVSIHRTMPPWLRTGESYYPWLLVCWFGDTSFLTLYSVLVYDLYLFLLSSIPFLYSSHIHSF